MQKELAPFADEIDKKDDWDKRKVTYYKGDWDRIMVILEDEWLKIIVRSVRTGSDNERSPVGRATSGSGQLTAIRYRYDNQLTTA